VRVTQDLVAKATVIVGKLGPGELMGRSQMKHVALHRAAAQWLCIKMLGRGYSETGRFFNRDHTSIIAAINKIDALLADDPEGTPTDKLLDEIWTTAKKLANGEIEPRKITPVMVPVEPVPRIYHDTPTDGVWSPIG